MAIDFPQAPANLDVLVDRRGVGNIVAAHAQLGFQLMATMIR